MIDSALPPDAVAPQASTSPAAPSLDGRAPAVGSTSLGDENSRLARRAMQLLFVVATMTLAIAGTTPVSRTRAILRVEAESVKTVTADRTFLTRTLPARGLDIDGIASVTDEAGAEVTASAVAARTLEATTAAGAPLWLQQIDAAAGASMVISSELEDARLQLLLEQESGVELTVLLLGASEWIRDGKPEPITERTMYRMRSARSSRVGLELAREVPCIVCQPVAIQALEFVGSDLVQRNGKLVDVAYSSIHSATYTLPEIDEAEHHLSFRDALRVQFDTSAGSIGAVVRRIRRTDSGLLQVEVDGAVKSLATGSVDLPRDLMPSFLTWLKARHSFEAIWSGAIFICGIALWLFQAHGVKVWPKA